MIYRENRLHNQHCLERKERSLISLKAQLFHIPKKAKYAKNVGIRRREIDLTNTISNRVNVVFSPLSLSLSLS